MIICPSCQNAELVGSLFCSNCGASLSHLDASAPITDKYKPDKGHAPTDEPHETHQSTQTAPNSVSGSALQILSTGDLILLKTPGEFTLGRVSGNQPILPDIDLTPFQAYETGVSRLHATIQIEQDRATIIDLGSANGTRVNGIRIAAHAPYPIKDSDIFSLGNFNLRIIMRSN